MRKSLIIGLLSILVGLFSIATINNIFSNVMAIEDYYYHENEDDYYDTKVNKYECQKGDFEGFYTSSPEFCKKELPSSSSLLPSESPTTGQPGGFGSSVYVAGVVTFNIEVTKISTVTNQVSRFSQPLSGTTPHAIAFDPVHNRIYMTTQAGVQVLDTDLNRVVQPQIDVGVGGARGIAFDPVHNKMYVTNFNLNTVAVIDTNTNTVVATIGGVGVRPIAIAFDSEHNRMYVVNQGGTPLGTGSVSIIDTNTNTVVGSPINVGVSPQGIAFDTVFHRMFITNSISNSVLVIDTNTNTLFGPPITVSSPWGIAYDRLHERMYVTNFQGNTVTVIDVPGDQVEGLPISVGRAPTGIAFDPEHNRMYVTNRSDHTVSVINTNTNTVIGSPIGVQGSPTAIAFGPG